MGCNARFSCLALAVALALGTTTVHAAPTACPLGAEDCARPTNYSQCRQPVLYADWVAGLPGASDTKNAPTQVDAGHMLSPDSNHFQLNDHVRIQHGAQLLRADHVDYQRDSGHYDASGNVRYQDPSLQMRARQMQGTTTPREARADQVRYQLRDSRGNGRAAQVQTLPDDRAHLDAVDYSTCNLEDPGWLLRAKSIDLDQNTGIGRAHDVTIRIGDVPVLWLPYARFPIDAARHTGFLYPLIGYSNTRGLDITAPLYLNLAPNYDATLYPRVLGKRGFMLGGEFRYLTDTSHGEIRYDYLAHDRAADRSRSLLRARSQTHLAPGWNLDVNLNHVSDPRYFEDFGDGLSRSATQLLASSIYLRGSGQWWDAAIGADRYQITDPTLSQTHEPYRRMPRATFDADVPLAGGLSVDIDSEAVSFHRDASLDGRRVDLYPHIEWALQGPYWHITPQVGYRYTAYHLDRDNDADPTRTMPIASVDAGLTFERPTSLFGNSYTQTLEPRLFYLRVPYRNQDDLPLFDTNRQTFDFWQLFSTNSFTGADRQMNANNLTVALTSRLLDDNGSEKLSASLGQIRYFDPQRVHLPGQATTDANSSAYIAQISTALSDNWRFNAAQQWNPNNDHHTDLSTVGLQRRVGGDGVVNFSYRYRRDFLEQFDVSTDYPLNDRWRLLGRWNVSLRDNRTLEAFAGFEYDSCCVAVRLLARHYVRNTQGDIGNGIMMEIELKGLGSFGQHTEDFLQHAILGYH